MTEKNKLHLECSCGSHGFHFEKEDDPFPVWYVSLWLRGYQGNPNWKYRLRQILRIIKTGEPYADEIVLEKKDLVELQEYIKKQLEA